MYIREKPLLEKIKLMREQMFEISHSYDACQEENRILRRQIEIYQRDEPGDERLKKHIKVLQSEI